MAINWWTLALQGINFLLLVWLLERFLYRPVRDVIAKRKELSERAFAEARKAKDEAEAAGRKFDEDRLQLARERQALLKKLHDELADERSKTIEQARGEADTLLKDARTAMAEERAETLSAMRAEITALAADMATTLLRGSGSGIPSDVFLSQMEKKLNSLPDEERAQLGRDLAANGSGLTVVTAAPLAPEEEARWRERLGACLGELRKTDFVADPAIIGGAELRFPHTLIRDTWASRLETAKKELGRDDGAAR